MAPSSGELFGHCEYFYVLGCIWIIITTYLLFYLDFMPSTILIDCLLPNGVIIQLKCFRDSTLEKIKVELWREAQSCGDMYLFLLYLNLVNCFLASCILDQLFQENIDYGFLFFGLINITWPNDFIFKNIVIHGEKITPSNLFLNSR